MTSIVAPLAITVVYANKEVGHLKVAKKRPRKNTGGLFRLSLVPLLPCPELSSPLGYCGKLTVAVPH